jgi:hypothetical protein
MSSAKRAHEGDCSDHALGTKRARTGAVQARAHRLGLPGVFGVKCVLAGRNDELFIGTMTALYLQVNGRVALIAGHSSEEGYKDGQGDKARFDCIEGLAMERGGSVLLCDGQNNSVRRVSPHGQVTTVAGNGAAGFADGVGDAARFNWPQAIEVDSHGLIYVADSNNHCIRTVQPADGTVSTLCGKGRQQGCVNGPAAEARFWCPRGLALDMNEDLIVADCYNHSVRKVAMPDGRVTTVAGSVEGGDAGKCYVDDTGTAARFSFPSTVALDGSNAIFVADGGNSLVRRISGEGGVVTTFLQNDVADESESYIDEPDFIAINRKGQLFLLYFGAVFVVHGGVVPPRLGPTAMETADQKALRMLQSDYSCLLQDISRADVAFATDGGIVRAHRLILAARSPYFRMLFENGSEARASVDDPIPMLGIPAAEFETVLRFLYSHKLPPMAAFAQGLSLCSLARVADYLQATVLYEHCLEEFKGNLVVQYVINDLMEAHDNKLLAFEQAALDFIHEEAEEFKEQALDSLDALVECHECTTLAVRVAKALCRRPGPVG